MHSSVWATARRSAKLSCLYAAEYGRPVRCHRASDSRKIPMTARAGAEPRGKSNSCISCAPPSARLAAYFRSQPAQKAPPAPVKMATRASLRSNSRNAVTRSSAAFGSTAFARSALRAHPLESGMTLCPRHLRVGRRCEQPPGRIWPCEFPYSRSSHHYGKGL
jgi:hypothetical protein